MSNSEVKRANALLEIGCEEIPADYIVPALQQMEKALMIKLKDVRLEYSSIQTEATARRFVLIIHDLMTMQSNRTKEVFGPKKAIAYKADGSLSPAGEGFLKKFKLSPDQIQIKDEKLFAAIEEIGQSAADLLPDIFLTLIKSVAFPKSMRWEESGARFARPVRWLVALLDKQVIPFSFADVIAGKETVLHPLSDKKQAIVASVDQYQMVLSQGKVVLSQTERVKILKTLLKQEAKQCGGRLVEDKELLDMVNMMCEFPGVLSGTISEKFMQMPGEIITTAMREHQRYFAVKSEQGELMPFFLAVYDNPKAQAQTICPGFENVLAARLQDAQFFYAEDVKHSLAERVPELDRVRWVRGLGSLLDKTKRLEFLGVWFAQALDPAARQDTVAAARLAKADLITNMVQEKEFTSLQGIMGSIYAQAQGLPESVVKAMAEQYLPRWAGDKLPETPTGRLLSLADKFDHIIGCWGAGFAPTGAKDPYALRRAVQGVIAITLDAGYRYSLPAVLEQCLSQFETLREKADTIISEVIGFIQGRLETELANREIAPDLSQAVLGVWWNDISAVVQKAEAIHQLRSNQGFNESIVTFSRVVNILPKGTPRQVAPEEQDLPMRQDLLTQPAEKELYMAYQEIGQTIADLSQKGDFITSFKTLGQLKTSVDQFFDDVLVMDKNEEIRENRLNLLTNLARKIWSLADFSKLVVSE